MILVLSRKRHHDAIVLNGVVKIRERGGDRILCDGSSQKRSKKTEEELRISFLIWKYNGKEFIQTLYESHQNVTRQQKTVGFI